MKFLASKQMSAVCFVLNCIFAAGAWFAGDVLWFIFSGCLAALCFYNYSNSVEGE